MATTPPPPSPSALRVPAAPRHGAGYDQFEPYPTRYSARLAGQRASRTAEITPPPNCPSSPSKGRSRVSPKKYQRVEEETLSPPGSSSKPPVAASKAGRRNNFAHSLAYNAFEFPAPHNSHSSTQPPSHPAVSQALPTPAKTPSKKKVSGDPSSPSRTLFPTRSTMSAKTATPFSLESFETSATSQTAIQIYTDSRDRIPKPSESVTPFAAKGGSSDSSSSSGARAAKAADPVANADTQDGPATAIRDGKNDSHTPEDGMTMIFRGKKVFNKFDKLDEEGDDDELGLFAARPDLLDGNNDILNSVKPLTRGSIKPRMLFARKKDDHLIIEEGATDDEDRREAEPSPPCKSPVATPQSPEFPRAPAATSGATRLTRSTARYGTQIEGTPTAHLAADGKRKRGSPFDNWLRKKKTPEDASTSGQTTPRKRDARAASPTASPPIAKKTRSARPTNST